MNDAAAGRKVLLSLIITVYNGEKFLAESFARLMELEKSLPDAAMEIIAVDDGSADNSFAELLRLQKLHPGKMRVIRFRRNFGAMAAAQAGIDFARGDCVAALPQDLQDPPEAVLQMFAAWRAGDMVNITHRTVRTEPLLKKTLAAAYHFLFRLLTGIKYPRGGLGVFLIDRKIAEEISRAPQKHTDIVLRMYSLGHPVRLHAAVRLPPKTKSNWTFRKNIKLLIDNFIAFSYLPVRLMSLAGIVMAFAGFGFACYVFVGKATGWYVIDQPPGWATIVVLATLFGGMLMLMLGVIGEYIWRMMDYARNEPSYAIAEVLDNTSAHPASEESQAA